MPPDRDSVSPDSPIITIDLSHALEENGERKIWGRATIPKVDKENELVTRQAIENALKNFMALPILHYNHTERPIGWVVSAYFGDDDGLYIEGRIKQTSDTDDVWKRIESGELTQFSIFGRRVEGNASCRLRPGYRDTPCITSGLHLDSISVCPKGNALGDSFLEIVKGWCGIEKASDSTSALIHPVVDGVEKSEIMPDDDAGAPAPEPAADQPSDQQSAIASVLQQVLDRIDALEEKFDGIQSYGGVGTDEVQKGEDAADDESGDDEDEGPDLTEVLTSIGEVLQMILHKLDQMTGDQDSGDEETDSVQKGDDHDYPDDGYEDDEDGEDEPEAKEDEISKCPLKKAESDSGDGEDQEEAIRKAREESLAEIEDLRAQVTELKKAIAPRQVVEIPDLKKGTTGNNTTNTRILTGRYGG